MSETLNPTAAVTPPAAATTPTAAWYEGKADPAHVGLWQNKGWNKDDPSAIALAATKAYEEAQKFVGAPASQLLRLPTDPNSDEWKGVWSRLGVPSEGKEYDLSNVKFADGSPLDPSADAFIREQAHLAHISKDAAAGFAAGLVKFLEGAEAGDAAETAAKLAVERDTLTRNWGANFEANRFVASKGAEALGLNAQEIGSLEGVMGYARIMEAMRKVGELNGEAKYVSSNGGNNSGIMTREQAISRKGELMTDTAWKTRFMSGDKAAGREMMALNTLITGG